jgi:hypothetical protein
MKEDGKLVEGEAAPRFRVQVNGTMQEGGFNTFEEARASVTRLDVNIEIFNGRRRVFGKELPWYPPRPGEKKRGRKS